MTAPHADQIIGDYIARLSAALAPVAPERRQELLDEVHAHIDEARAGLKDESDADVLNIIDRLGDPSETAAAELEPVETPAPAPRSSRGLDVAALVLLVLFWPVGILLVWLSDSWTRRQKLIGTLVPPGGYFGTAILTGVALYVVGSVQCMTVSDSAGVVSSTCPSGATFTIIDVTAIVLAVLYVIGPLLTAAYLASKLVRRSPAAKDPVLLPASVSVHEAR